MGIKYIKADTKNSFVDGPFGSNLKSDHYVYDGDVYVVESGFISTGKFIYKDFKTITKEHFETIKRSECVEGDIIIAKIGANYGMAGELPRLDKQSVVSGNSLKLTLNQEIMLNYLFIRQLELAKNNGGFINIVNETAQPALSLNSLNSFRLLVPPISEQTTIVRFLYDKCTEIDYAITDIQSQIETLEEYKRSVITEAVTKGLDLDVEMRDSGDEWIGMIPDHWKIMRIGRLFHLRNEKNYLPMEQVQLLSLYTDIGVFPHGEHEERGNKAVTVDGYNIVKKNDIVVNIILAWMGAIGISNYEGVTSPAYDVYVPDLSKVVPHYFHYVLRTSGIAGECYKYGRGIMMMRWRTYSSEFKLINVPYPNLREQQQIADYLDSKCAEIDSIIAEKKQQIETIEEYKKSLIFEYVTGKKEVPIWK